MSKPFSRDPQGSASIAEPRALECAGPSCPAPAGKRYGKRADAYQGTASGSDALPYGSRLNVCR